MRKVDEEVRKEIEKALKEGKVVILHPEASKKFSGSNVKPIDYPR